MGERGLDPLLPLRVRVVVGGLVGWFVCALVGGRGGLNLRTAIPKGALVAEKNVKTRKRKKKSRGASRRGVHFT